MLLNLSFGNFTLAILADEYLTGTPRESKVLCNGFLGEEFRASIIDTLEKRILAVGHVIFELGGSDDLFAFIVTA